MNTFLQISTNMIKNISIIIYVINVIIISSRSFVSLILVLLVDNYGDIYHRER